MFNRDDDFSAKPDFTWLMGFDAEYLEAEKQKLKEFALMPSGMKFLDEHFGPRPKTLSVLLGSTGKGKSTLVRSLVMEFGKKLKVLVYLSEEAIDRFEIKMSEMSDDASYLSPKLHMIHEHDFLKTVDPSSPTNFLLMLEAKVAASQARILFIDNLTTSRYYDANFKNVPVIIQGLRRIAIEHDIPIFIVAHTKKGTNEGSKGYFFPDDIRGSAQLGMQADYFYSFSRVHYTTAGGAQLGAAFIYTGKCRDHDTQDRIYRLDYDVNKKLYTKDTPISYETFKEIVNKRNK